MNNTLFENETKSFQTHSGKAILTQLKAMDRLGFNTCDLLSSSGLTRYDIDNTSKQLPITCVSRFYGKILQLANDPTIGLKLGEAFAPACYGFFGHAMLHAQTLRQALIFGRKFSSLTFSYFKFELVVYGDRAEVVLVNYLPIKWEALNLLIDRDVSAILVILSAIMGHTFPVKHVELPHNGVGKTTVYENYFGCKVKYSQSHAKIVFCSSLLERESMHNDPKLFDFMSLHCHKLSSRLTHGSSTVDQVSMIMTAKPGFFPNIEYISDKMGTPIRTLRRKLTQENSSYRQILDNTRFELAKEYLAETRLSLSEISSLLGYSNHANFSYAFARWSNFSPCQYRQMLVQGK